MKFRIATKGIQAQREQEKLVSDERETPIQLFTRSLTRREGVIAHPRKVVYSHCATVEIAGVIAATTV